MKIWKYAHDIQAIIHQHCALASDSKNENQIEICKAFNRAMAEACFRHKREIDLEEQIPVEPVVHFATSVVKGVGE